MRPRLILIAGLVIVGAAAFAFRHFDEVDAAQKPAQRAAGAVPVTAATAAIQPVPVEIVTIGRVQTVASVVIRSRIDGVVDAVNVADGQDVKAGDVLFHLDDREAQAILRETEANLARDRAQLANAKREVERLMPLAEKSFASKQSLDQLQTNVAALESSVAADVALAEQSRVRLSYTVITAPIDGRIGTVSSKLGSSVRQGDATPLLTINQLTPIYVAFTVPQRDLLGLQSAMKTGPVRVAASIAGTEAAPGPPAIGEVAFFENSVDMATNTLLVKATFPNADRSLWPGQFVNVVLTLRVDRDALVVPVNAIQINQEGTYVWVIGADMTVSQHPVAVLRQQNGMATIKEGIAAGDRVVTNGQLRLTPGALVAIQPDADPGIAGTKATAP